MRRDEDFFQQFEGHTIFTGVCEARNDPAMLGRIQVRIFGLHSPDRTEIPTEALPWATVMLPTTMAGMSGVGATTSGIMEGTWVVGFFRDGPSCQDPIIIGTLLGNASARWPALSRDESVQQTPPQEEPEPNPKDPELDEKEKEAMEEIEQSKLSEFFDKVKEKWESFSLEKKLKELNPFELGELQSATPEEATPKDTAKVIADTPKPTIDEIKKNKTEDLEAIRQTDKPLLQKTKSLSDNKMDYLIEQKLKLEKL